MVSPPFFSASSTFFLFFFDMKFCSVLHKVLAGKATRGLWIGGRGAVLVVLVVRRQLDALLVHALRLHPLDETEEVFIRHCGGVLARLWRGAPLVVDPGGLRQGTNRKC